jgi:predicted membrane protein
MDETRPDEHGWQGPKRGAAGNAVTGRLRAPTGRVLLGLLIIALGVLFTLDNLGVVSAGEILRWWPAALLLYGVARLTGFCCRQGAVRGAIYTIAGAVLLLHEADLIKRNPWDFWPVVLIVIGATMMTRALQRASTRDALSASSAGGGGVAGAGPGGEPTSGQPGPGRSAANDYSPGFHTIAFWSGVERKILSQQLRHGEVTAFMGGLTLDLRGARLAEGTATIDLVVLMGGVDLYVPPTWKVSVETVTLLGGFEDASRAPAGEASGHLILKGVVLMGGVDVKN